MHIKNGTQFKKKQDITSENIELNVYAECILLIYKSTLPAVGAIVTAVCFLIYLLHSFIPAATLYGWGGYMFFVALLRFAAYWFFRRVEEKQRGAFWGRVVILMAGATGLGWGVSSLLFFPLLTFELKLVLLLVVVAYTTGALTTMFPMTSALLALMLPSVSPLVYLTFEIGGHLAISIGVMLLFFLGFITVAAARLRELLLESLTLRFKNEELNESLLLEVEERKKSAEKLIEARKEAELANMAKTQFLANMSHDIRTPMNAVIGMTGLLIDTELTKEKRKFLDNIKVSSEGLLGLLNDILDFSKIEAGQLLIVNHDFNFQKMLEDIESTMIYSATEKGLLLEFPQNNEQLPLYVHGDALRLRQILLNLIGNAIKFTQSGSVRVEVQSTTQADDSLFLHCIVHDTGIGIPNEKHNEIFTHFSQTDFSITREFGGSGLGLTICRELVEMMDGKIWLESEPGKGSSFHFSLPLRVGKEENIPGRYSDAEVVRKLRILIADDNQLNRELAQLILEKEQHTIAAVDNGLQALQRLVDERFDLIFMDVQMPIMDGLTASVIIRKSEQGNDLSIHDLPEMVDASLREKCRGRHIPIIAMTAHAMEGDKQKCLDAGMDGYLTKPFDPAQMHQVIAEIFA